MKITEIFKQLETTNSTKDKQALLEANKNNVVLKELLEANLNPYKMYYVKKMPCEFISKIEESGWTDKDWHDAFMSMLTDLSERLTTGNEAKKTISAVMRAFDKEHFELYSKILLKAPIGVGTSTVNKVWPKLIPEFKVMLAPSQLPNLTELQYPLYIQPKYDGFRAIFYNGKFYTRSGLVYSNNNLLKHFDKLKGMKDYVLDGELYIHGQPFQDLAKTLNADEAAIPKSLKYHVYDCLPIKDWDNQSTKMTYTDRLKLLRSVLNDTVADYSKVIDAPTDKVESSAEVVEIYKKMLKNGYEGVILKAVEGKYKWGRCTLKSGEMLKVKPKETIDVTVKSIFEGTGKFISMAGGITFNYGNTIVSCGSGFNDKDREEMWKTPNNFVGKMAEIEFMEETEDQSLRHPVFIRWRFDKNGN